MKSRHILSCKPNASSPSKSFSETEFQSYYPRYFHLSESHATSLIRTSTTIPQLKQIHSHIIIHKLSSSSRVSTLLISSSSFLKSPHYALAIFQSFSEPNLFIFNALIRALADNSQFESSISHYKLMLQTDVRPNRLTLPFVLRSATELLDGKLGTALHGGIMKIGVEFETFVRVSLVDLYAKVDHLISALQVFDESSEKNKTECILLWNVLIGGCCRKGDLRKATELFQTMPERSVGSWNCLIHGFMKHGESLQAWELFNQMPEKNVVSWTTMVAGFSQIGDHEKALSLFFKMLEMGIRPNDHTFISAITACAKVGALDSGVQIHQYISNNRFRLKQDTRTALVDMYAKCGDVESAEMVFSSSKSKDLRSWSVMIWGWAIHGRCTQAIRCFNSMKATGIKPDGVVFLGLLVACSHSGQVSEGLRFFNSMTSSYSILPTMKHYALVVDLLCRAGRVKDAYTFIISMPVTPSVMIWGALFCACRGHRNTEIAELASHHILQLNPNHQGAFVFLSNIYAAAQKWEEVEKVRDRMKQRGMRKDPGWSYIDRGSEIHSFVSSDCTQERGKDIDVKLEEIRIWLYN